MGKDLERYWLHMYVTMVTKSWASWPVQVASHDRQVCSIEIRLIVQANIILSQTGFNRCAAGGARPRQRRGHASGEATEPAK